MKKLLKKVLTIMLSIIIAFSFSVPASTNVQAATKKVKSIIVTNLPAKQLTLKKGKSYTLNVKVSVSGGASKAVIYTSSNKKVATVTSKGKITAKKKGTTNITIKSKVDKSKKVIIKVTVGTPVTKIKLNKTSTTVAVGNKVTLKATVTPSKASNKTVIWSSSNKKVATITSKGVVRGVKAGTAKITATAKDGSGKKATCIVTVKNIGLSKTNISLDYGKSTTIKLNGGKIKSVKSSNTSVATITKAGEITGKKVGTATITVTSTKGIKYTCKVTVNAYLDKTKITLASGDNASVVLKGSDIKSVKSSNISVATITKTGKINAKGQGSATLTIIDTKGKKHICKVTVESPSLSKSSLSLVVGNTFILKLNNNTQKVTWSSSADNIATVNSSGKVTAKAIGTAIITAKVASGKTYECSLTVTNKDPNSYIVTFESNGGSVVESQIVEEGEYAVTPEIPVKDGYIFGSWYTDSEFTSEYDFSRRVRENMTLYARWLESADDTTSYTRGEWLNILAEMINMNLDTDKNDIDYYYADTEESEYAVVIETAQAYGLIPNEELEDAEQDVPFFYPEEVATREFVAYTVSKAMGFEDITDTQEWDDWNSITYKSAAVVVVKFDLMRLNNNMFSPSEPLSENDVMLIQQGIIRLNNSVEITSEDSYDYSVYAENVVKDEIASVEDYTVTVNENDVYTVIMPFGRETSDIKSGDIVVLPSNNEHPTGVAVKATSVITSENQVIITGIVPEVEDVFTRIDFAGNATALVDQAEGYNGVEVKYNATGEVHNNGVSTRTTVNVGASTAIPGTFKFTIPAASGQLTDNLKIKGSVEIEIPDVTCVVDANVGLFSGISVNEFTFSIKEKIKIKDELTCTLAESGYELTNSLGNTRFEAGRIELGRVPFAIGATGLSLDLVFFVNVSAKGSLSVTYTIVAQEGLQYKNGAFRTIKNFSDSLDFLEIKGTASATIGAAADICAFEMMDLIGISIEAGPAFNASFTPHVLATDTLYCGDITLYATAKVSLDQETAIGKFLKKNYVLEYELLKNDSNNPLKMKLHVENGIKTEECTFGRGEVIGSVVALNTGEAICGARIQVYDENNTLIRTKYTSIDGKYDIDNLDSGTYKVSISANNYQRYDISVEISNNVITYAETAKMVSRTETTGSLQGNIIDATNGNGISNTSYLIYKGWNITSGEVVASGIFTSSSYELELETGNYTIIINKSGYISNSVNVAVESNSCTTSNITLSPESAGSLDGADNIRIVLTWGATPSDLDSHLFGPTTSGSSSYFHTCYFEKKYYYGGVLMANLDLDDTSSYGPETTTIYSVMDEGIYSFYVHDFTNRGECYSTALSLSEAKVQIYVGNTLYYTFNVPTDMDGTVWHVFDYNAETDTVVPINTFSYDSDKLFE